jgi:hypothetical protein
MASATRRQGLREPEQPSLLMALSPAARRPVDIVSPDVYNIKKLVYHERSSTRMVEWLEGQSCQASESANEQWAAADDGKRRSAQRPVPSGQRPAVGHHHNGLGSLATSGIGTVKY